MAILNRCGLFPASLGFTIASLVFFILPIFTFLEISNKKESINIITILLFTLPPLSILYQCYILGIKFYTGKTTRNIFFSLLITFFLFDMALFVLNFGSYGRIFNSYERGYRFSTYLADMLTWSPSIAMLGAFFLKSSAIKWTIFTVFCLVCLFNLLLFICLHLYV